MVGRSPDVVVETFVARLHRALSCVLRGVVVSSGAAPGLYHSVTIFVKGRNPSEPVALRTHGGDGQLLFKVAHLYQVETSQLEVPDGQYAIRTTFYHYDILDRDGSEIVVYHFEPEGISPVRLPHLHVPAAKSIVLPQRLGSALANRQTHLGKLHLLTGRVQIEDVIEVLIREFAVGPLRADWEAVLARGREQAESGG